MDLFGQKKAISQKYQILDRTGNVLQISIIKEVNDWDPNVH